MRRKKRIKIHRRKKAKKRNTHFVCLRITCCCSIDVYLVLYISGCFVCMIVRIGGDKVNTLIEDGESDRRSDRFQSLAYDICFPCLRMIQS